MGVPRSPDQRIARIAARQHGVFTRAQALAEGATPKMIRGRVELGLWLPVHRGVFRIGGAPAALHTRVMAACLATSATAACRTAALLWGMPAPEPSGVEVVVAHGTRRTRNGITVYQATTLMHHDVVRLHEIPVTSPARTLIDVAGVLSEPQLEYALDDALARGLVKLARVEHRLDQQSLAGHRGAGTLRRLVAAYAPATAASGSHLAQSFLRLFRRLGLPEPVPEMPVLLLDGRVIHVDFGYPAERVAVEIQSRRWHTGRRKTEEDLGRENELELAGFRLVHLVERDRRRPEYVERVMLGALEARSRGFEPSRGPNPLDLHPISTRDEGL